MELLLQKIKKLVPRKVFLLLRPFYHFSLAFLGALVYGFSSRKLFVIAVTGTKGKTTTVELINSILEEAGHKTSIASTLRFKIGKDSKPNLYKMTMPGRFKLQKFFRDSIKSHSKYVIVEMTSEGAAQFRHRFIKIDALVFTNIEPEHIESHGSYEKYLGAKLEIAKQLLKSSKGKSIFVGNGDDKEVGKFLNIGMKNKRLFYLKDAGEIKKIDSGWEFSFRGKKVKTNLVGEFNIYNCLAALSLGEAVSLDVDTSIRALEKFEGVLGRAQEIKVGQKFKVVVDYAHTPKSLEAIYRAYEGRRICVLSGTGGGRDRWKRPLMGEIASSYCDSIILTDEDPYDENPMSIVEDIKRGIKNKNVLIEIDRREAIREAFREAKEGDVVLITGKGTDPYIMGPNGTKTLWSDSSVSEEELQKLGYARTP